ncbi:MAG TPA: FAD-binding oxidoreductase [Acidimicrobiales bacterium]|nr:FAD-binding oxidoreductase [Acidimicrobiales bacterium]
MAVTAGSLESFRGRFAGRVVTAADTDYDAVRAECVWNGDIDRRPWVIARATSPADVAEAVRFARSEGRVIAVRGGGHGFAGACIADDAVMIDLGPLDRVDVDPGGRRATCGGGARWSQVDSATQEHALGVPGGFISHTGIGGLTLGGGMGWMTRRAGLSCDNLTSAEVVTADSRVLTASRQEYPDLFWAIRGGGGNFGVVTSFEFSLHPTGPMVQLALSFWDLDHGPDAFRAARDLVPSLDEGLGIFLAALNAPPAPFVPDSFQGVAGYAVLVADFDPDGAGARAAADLRAAQPPQFVFDTPIPYTHLQQMFDESAPWQCRGYEKALYLEELTDPVIEVIARHFPRKSSPMSFMPTFVLGGDFARHSEEETAFGGGRDTRYVLNIAAVAPTADLLDADRQWVRDFWSDLTARTGTVASYVNFMSEFEDDRLRATYGAAKYERLAGVKATYDPDNVFRLNPNIRPATL